MKIFLDTAHLQDIKQWAATGLIDGITTNPTNLAHEKGNAVEIVRSICGLLPDGDISVEVTEQEPEAVYKQAKAIAAIAPNVVVKIPCHVDYYPVIGKLVQEEINVNITLVFSLIQGLLMCKLGVQYISPFVGRLEEIGVDGLDVIRSLRDAVDTYEFSTQILAASLRTVRHVHDVIEAGADAMTLPVDIMKKMTDHPLTNKGIEKFLADWRTLGIRQFP